MRTNTSPILVELYSLSIQHIQSVRVSDKISLQSLVKQDLSDIDGQRVAEFG